ncbi:hypothetical protein VZT92_002631 [Zoarces viviparus]|uniref:Uncharacterized protein n=1 Tax=Zoarces viviparus TaxID=48416 RepID=A0AAW1G055_ZOAVI
MGLLKHPSLPVWWDSMQKHTAFRLRGSGPILVVVKGVTGEGEEGSGWLVCPLGAPGFWMEDGSHRTRSQ